MLTDRPKFRAPDQRRWDPASADLSVFFRGDLV
jgi:hypothetical protein